FAFDQVFLDVKEIFSNNTAQSLYAFGFDRENARVALTEKERADSYWIADSSLFVSRLTRGNL
ncbi:MAG: hypothetical protein MI723_05185, partial [Caulobacterales bacterium]|nr:hypothetical protein [Caulobacterales bacterium]